jgi:protein TIF31
VTCHGCIFESSAEARPHLYVCVCRLLNKVLVEFGEASLLGVKAISDGQIAPMNPNEMTRSQVYLHNSIFFSRAVDAGVETFKIARGDRAARKSASRDIQCLGALHRMERTDLHTLATVLIDYMGTRYVCQSILPGILSGEKAHTLLYGAVEAGSPLMWDKEMHEALESTFGKVMMVATRAIPRNPLTDERAAEIQELKNASPLYLKPQEEEKQPEEASPTISVCAPIEAKGIRGSDQRKYVLDMTRLTPRDANWVMEKGGGTGKWESLLKPNGSSKVHANIPKQVDDDEWILAVLRSELVTNYTGVCMSKFLKNKKEAEKDNTTISGAGEEKSKEESTEDEDEKKAADKAVDAEKSAESEEEKQEKAAKASLSEEQDLEHLKSLRFNVNVFLPDIKSLEGIDDAAVEQMKNDEEMARKAAIFLWEDVMPGLTFQIREGAGIQIPHGGRSLTELIHQHGINCRYLGRLASLAQEEEAKDLKQIEDLKQGKPTSLSRRTMPRFWLDLLECEMVARAAKHVLDSYLTENGGTAAKNPAQTVASFLCSLVSEAEETAAQTETRVDKQVNASEPDEDDFNSLTMCDTGGDGDAVSTPIRGRSEVWADIEKEIGRRFRYTLSLYNPTGKAGRALYIPLLRRVCQRTGVRLAAKNYEVGGKCLCSDGGTSGGRLTVSYPISPLDIIDIVPLMKHAAAHGEGFVPCALGGPTVGLPPLHISLPDARAALESAHRYHNARSLSRALDLAQEACGLYQRVTETPAHPGVVRCIDLMASILFDAGEPALAALNADKAIGLLVQIGGFDAPDVITSHLVLFQILVAAGQMTRGVKHVKAALYLMELMGGPRHIELSNLYHKLGTIYHQVGGLLTALRLYQESTTRECCDRVLEAMIAKSTAMALANLGEFKLAVENEKRAFHLFSLMLGGNHSLTKSSDQSLKKLTAMAVEHGNLMVKDTQKRQEEYAAELIATEIQDEEAAEAEKKKKKNNKKKKGKK